MTKDQSELLSIIKAMPISLRAYCLRMSRFSKVYHPVVFESELLYNKWELVAAYQNGTLRD